MPFFGFKAKWVFVDISRLVLTVPLRFSALVRNDFGVRANWGIFLGLSLIDYSLFLSLVLAVGDSWTIYDPASECRFNRSIRIFGEPFDKDAGDAHVFYAFKSVWTLPKEVARVHVVVQRANATVGRIPARTALW